MSNMNRTLQAKTAIKAGVVALTTLLTIGCASEPELPVVSDDGLTLQYDKHSTIAYKKEGVDFSVYEKLHILPSQVAFKKDWQRDYNRDHRSNSQRMTDEDVLDLKNKITTLFDKTFKEELSKGQTKRVVEDNGVNTLLLKPFVIDLDLYAPDINTGSNVKTYVKETGEATLYLEIFDGVSGEILARIIDQDDIGNDTYMRWANRVTNKVDAERTIRKWANALNKQFDKAQQK